MADDPNRDILPVKDDSCYGSVRCFSEIDPRERHIVCKLDRYQLEDRYLRLLEEVQGLKKLSNSQEDKIKRLATKLMRSAASSRTCPTVFTINDDREKITRLELENARLKDKAYTLKNQLLSHRGPRSPSRCRRVASGVSSGPTTYRSETARTKYQPRQSDIVDDNDAQNYLLKIEELESQRNEMMGRITELENQIAVHVAGIQKEKVQDNVEYIRVWRQMKQANDKLLSVQATNDILHGQIRDLKKLLDETTKNNKEVTAALVSEKQRLSDMDDQITSAKDSQLSLREKDQQIRDLTNEMKILQQHNDELIALSSKIGQVEVENIELKRRVSEYAQDNQNLKSAFNSEQADHVALRAANDKLIKKIEELQRNIDNLTMQLMTFQKQEEKRIVSQGTQTEAAKRVDKKIGTSYASKSYSISSEEERESSSDKVADERILRFSKDSGRGKTIESAMNIRTEMKDRSSVQSVPSSIKNSSIISSKTKHTSPSMSREKILMLLDQAQISTPLETQNAARIRQIDAAGGQNDASIFPESYRHPNDKIISTTRHFGSKATTPITTMKRRHSNDGLGSMDISSTPGDEDDQNYEHTEFFDPKQILLTLFEILKNYSEKIHESVESSCVCRDLESSSTENIDYSNSNNAKYLSAAESSKVTKTFRRNNEMNPTRKIFYEKLKTGFGQMKSAKAHSNKERSNLLHKLIETECCICDSNHRCLATSDCGYGCCAPETDHGLVLHDENNYSFPNNQAVGKSEIGEIGSSNEKMFDSIQMGCDLDYGCIAECYDHRNKRKFSNTSDHSKIDKGPKIVSSDLENCKELLCLQHNPHSDYKKENKFSKHKTGYDTTTADGDETTLCDISTFPLLITKGQGLVEIHIITLQLSAKAMQTLFTENSHDFSVFISWDIWDQETAFTPILKYPSLSFNSSSVYRVCELQKFFDRVLREQIVFHVHVINSDKKTFTIGKAMLSVKDILDYPQNKLHYITPVQSMMPCPCGGNFGQLSLWIRLSCDVNLVENFKDRRGLTIAVSRHKQMQIPAQLKREYNESSSKKDSLPMNSTPLNELYSFTELIPPLPMLQEVSKHPKNATGYLPEAKNNRLDTIRETAEPGDRVQLNQSPIRKTKYRYENPDEQLWDTNVKRATSLTTSFATKDNDSQDSDAGFDGTMEKIPSQDVRVLTLQNGRDSGQQIETESITEFNNILNKQSDGSSLHETESTMDDLGEVIADNKWEKYKRSSDRTSISLPAKTMDSSLENNQNVSSNKNFPTAKDTIIISIVSMNVFDKTSLMSSPDIHFLYIEYTFLGIQGVDMETISLPKPKNKGELIVFNFTKKFQIDQEYHNSQRNMLNAMLSGTASPIIRFVIVSEPLPEDADTKECVEVGHADFNIREYALGDGLRDVQLVIMDPSQAEEFGILKITIDGVEIIRNCMMVQKRL